MEKKDMTKFKEGWWMNYLHSVRQSVNRELTEKEISSTMKLYIAGKPVLQAVRELEE